MCVFQPPLANAEYLIKTGNLYQAALNINIHEC